MRSNPVRWPVRIARLTASRPAATIGVAALVVALAGWRIAQLRLETSFTELLSQRDSAVVVLHDLDHRMPALSSLNIVIEGPNPAANRTRADELRARLLALGDPLIDSVSTGVQEERDFFRANRWLYASSSQLADADAQLRNAIARRQNPLYVDLDDSNDETALDSVERNLDRPPPSIAKFPDGYFSSADGRLGAVVIWLRSSFLKAGPEAAATVRRVREVVRTASVTRPMAGQTIGLTGNLITAAAEKEALAADLGLVTGITVVLVCLVVFLYFGRLIAVPLVVAPTFIGTAVALAFAQLAFGQLNIATAFLGAIIVGNGINYAIVQMARYDEERTRGRGSAEAAEIAVAASWRGTATAAIGAAVAYGTLALTDFRGFNQFGVIGCIGMIVSWLGTVAVLPAACALVDRGAGRLGHGKRAPRLLGPARALLRRPASILIGATLLTVAAAIPLTRFAADPFEYDFAKLRNQAARSAEAERLSAKASSLLGRSLSPSFVLADRPDQASAIKQRLIEGDRARNVLGSVVIIEDFLPGSPTEQRDKLATLRTLRDLIDTNAELAGSQRDQLLRLRPPDTLRTLSPSDLPASVRRSFTERDGTTGRVVAYFPRQDISVWDGRVQTKLASLVREIRLPDGSHVRSSGSAVVFAGMLDAIRRDGPRLTLISFVAVAVLLGLVTGVGVGAATILASLCMGVTWMIAALALAGVRLNFLNFVALPITFGIAVDYAANVYLRYRTDGPGSIASAVATTGGAVALCSLTTIIGYGSLLIADTQALRTFGAAAILGEIACLVTALVVLPSALSILERRKALTAGGSR